MKESVYFKGGSVHGQLIEVEIKEGPIYPPAINIASLSRDLSFDILEDRRFPPENSLYVEIIYHLVKPDNKSIPYYEHK